MSPERFQVMRLVWIGALALTFGVFGLGLMALLSALQFPQMLPIGLVAVIVGAAGHFWAIGRLDRLRKARTRGLSKAALSRQIRDYAASREGVITLAATATALGLPRPQVSRVLRDLVRAGEVEMAEHGEETVYRFVDAAARTGAARSRLSGTLLGWAGAVGEGAIAAANERTKELTLDVLAADAVRHARRAGGRLTPSQLARTLNISTPVARQALDQLAAQGSCRRHEPEHDEPVYVFD
jgi:DNA-binding MarR family transcriptional regulator